MNGKKIQFVTICLILASLLLASRSMGIKMKGGDAALGLPTDLTTDFGKGKPGLEVIVNRLDDQRKEKWFVEMHFGRKPKHLELGPNIDLMGRITNVVVNELTRANFKVIAGSGQPDPVRPVLSGAVTRYSGVFKQVWTAEISLDIVLTKGDTVLLKKTYVGVTERPAGKFPTPSKVQKIFAEMLRQAWEKLLSQMMPEIIETINKNS